MTINTKNINATISNLENSNSENLIGYLVWWNIPPKTTYSLEKVENLWNDLKLGNPTYPSITPISTFSRIMRTLSSEIPNIKTDFITESSKAIYYVTYKINTSVLDEMNVELNIEEKNIIAFDKENKKVEAKFNDYVFNFVKNKMETLCNKITHNDLSYTIIRKLFELGASPLRSRGGIYFVPYSDKNNKIIESLEKLLQELTLKELNIIPLIKNEKSIKTVYNEVKNQLKDEICNTVEKMKLALQKEKISTKEIKKTIEVFNNIRSKVELYIDILDLSKSELKELLSDSINEMKNILLSNLENK